MQLVGPQVPDQGSNPGFGSESTGPNHWTAREFPLSYFPGGSAGKNPPAMWETWVQSLGWEDPLEKGTATHSSILAESPMDRIVYGVTNSWT